MVYLPVLAMDALPPSLEFVYVVCCVLGSRPGSFTLGVFSGTKDSNYNILEWHSAEGKDIVIRILGGRRTV